MPPRPAPEAEAREEIDRLLGAAGWTVQDYARLNRRASVGVAVREYPLATGFADYLLLVDGKAVGVVEAKPAGTTLSGVAEQSAKYLNGLAVGLPAVAEHLPFAYESTGVETFFRDERDPHPRSRRVFAFHRPETLRAWAAEPATLRARLAAMPEVVEAGLRACQVEAISNLDRSLAEARPRALVQMATGSGKTFTAVSAAYRLIRHGGARRVLFLVDRANLGRQTLREFQAYRTPDDGRLFTELYNVQHLTGGALDADARVVIATIQRVYAMLRGRDLDTGVDEASAYEAAQAEGAPVEVAYTADVPIETFDVVIVDECHRSIYNVWRQVLDYFDAFLVGLTATPSKQTIGFFDKNLVMEFPHARAVAEGVNVPFEVYRIRTRISEAGSTVEAGHYVYRRDRRTRAERQEQLDEDLSYSAREIDRSVVVPDQIRTVVRAFRDALPVLFPGRTEVPKTLVFAKDDAHAEEIVRILREEFGRGNSFCKKITYRVSGEDPETLIKDFRTRYEPRIAVTVDMIATGTDVKPLECLLFLRDVKSQVYFDQMKGRGTRTIDAADLRSVTPDATGKTHFVIVDAVGVCETDKTDTRPLERKPSVPLAALVLDVARGRRDEATLSTLANRLSQLGRTLTPDEHRHFEETAGRPLGDIVRALVEATHPDVEDDVAEALADDACAPFDDPDVRTLVLDLRRRHDVTIDTVSLDEVTFSGADESAAERARTTVETFRQFIDRHRDEIDALRLFYSRPYGRRHVTLDQVRSLADALAMPPVSLTPEHLWSAYARIESGRVKGVGEPRTLADLVSLVRHVVDGTDGLTPYADEVDRRFHDWLAFQERQGRTFSPEQVAWLTLIRDHVATSLDVAVDDLDHTPFQERGGRLRAISLFGRAELPALLNSLNEALAP